MNEACSLLGYFIYAGKKLTIKPDLPKFLLILFNEFLGKKYEILSNGEKTF